MVNLNINVAMQTVVEKQAKASGFIQNMENYLPSSFFGPAFGKEVISGNLPWL